MRIKKIFYNRNIIPHTAVAVGGIYIAVRYADECYTGMEKGIDFCLGVLIPSLFFFMTVSAYIVQSGLAERLCKPLKGVSRILFRLPPAALAAILTAMIGGYPVGASCASILVKERCISPSEGAKTACIAVAAGPGFLISFIGKALLHNEQIGSLLLAAQVVAVILTGVIVGYTVDCEPLPYVGAPVKRNGDLLVSAVRHASKAAFGMCAMVVIFCALSEVADAVIADRRITDLISAVLEITNGSQRTCGKLPLPISAFFIGFGGLSVHFQIFSILGEIPLKKGLFFVFRIIEGIIAMAVTYIYLMVTPTTITVFSSISSTPSAARSATLAGSAALVISSLLFIGSVNNNSVFKRNREKHTEV